MQERLKEQSVQTLPYKQLNLNLKLSILECVTHKHAVLDFCC